ncbi:MAG: leucyl aminopeptidase [Planctomycetota bacterium]|jgi:leucyl aminopeptidase
MDWKANSAFAVTGRTDALVMFRAPAPKALQRLVVPDAALQESARKAIRADEFSGAAGESLLLHGGRAGRRLLLVGLGETDRDKPETLRRAAGGAARVLDARGIGRATFLVPSAGSGPDSARAIVEGAGLGMYRFDRFFGKPKKPKLTHGVVAPETGKEPSLAKHVREAAAVAAAVAFARDLGNLPGNVCTPAYLAKEAKKLAAGKGNKVTVKVHGRADIKRMRMGAFSAVAQGSHHEPKLVEFSYRGGGARSKTVALVGKGVTFDTGGISIKPSAGMQDMKFDMGGGAAVFGLMHLVAALQPKINIHALVPATDNMPDGNAYRPGDILTARNGKTIEVHSTDAEGRLLLCDALAYAAEKKPACMIDVATLTGACVVALADAACGLFGNDDDLVGEVKTASDASGEAAWHMPLYAKYTEMMKGTYADLQNSGSRWGGACTAAAFLQEFVAETPWIHLDIAGVGWTESTKGYSSKGATGFGVRLLWEFLRSRK